MGNSLLDKIKADAEKKAAEIKANGVAAAEAVAVETAAAVKVLEAEGQAALQKEQAQRELVATSKAKQAHKLAVQTAKRTAIDAIFADAFTQLASQSAADYIAEYTQRYTDTVPAGAAVTAITAPAGRREETVELLKQFHLTVDPVFTTSITAGLVVTTNDGVFDLTLDRRFKEARPELEMQVVAEINK